MLRLTIAAALLVLAACSAPQVKPTAAPPAVADQELSVSQELTDFKVTLNGKVSSAAATRIEKATYELVVEGKVVKSGEAQLGIDVPAGGSAPFSISDGARYVASAEELKAFSEKGGTLLAALRGKLHAQGGAAVEFAKSKEIRVPRLPKVKMNEAEGARYSDEEVNVNLYLGVENPNPFNLPINGISYKVWLAGKQLNEGTRGGGEKVSPSSTGVWEIQIPFNKETFGPDVKKTLKANTLPYEVKGTLKGDLFEIPFELKGDLKLNVSK